MRTEWLEDIMVVAETGSFSAAAERRGLTKSAFSRRLKHIEEQLGAEIFDRGSKPARLNSSVLEHQEGIRRVLMAVNEIVRDLQHAESVPAQVLRVGTTPSLSLTTLPDLTERAQFAVSNLTTRVFARGRDDVIGMLLSRAVDIAVVPRLIGIRDVMAPGVVEIADLGQEALKPFASPSVAKELLAGAFKNYPVIQYPPDTFFRRVLNENVMPTLSRSAPIHVRSETGSTIGLMGYVAKGFGVGWLPESLVEWTEKTSDFVDLTEILPEESMTISMMRLRDQRLDSVEQVWEAITTLEV